MEVSYSHLPRWRGFNLVEKMSPNHNAPFPERSFKWIADWGFNFVRLPMNYRCWTEPGDWMEFRESVLKEIDEAVNLGRHYGVHVNLAFHRAPGYCVSPFPREPFNLWEHDEALDVCSKHWALFARRYKGIPNEELSFNLFNEPASVFDVGKTTRPPALTKGGGFNVGNYVHVAKHLVEAIRGEDPDILIIADGLRKGKEPVFELVDLKIAQSTRGYIPGNLTHYKAPHAGKQSQFIEPTWPWEDDVIWDKDRLQRECIKPWKALEARGVGIHVGEWGLFNLTPHQVALAWMQDCLENWKEAGWGWALWNLRGDFGIVDSGRQDIVYEYWDGHMLDRAMLELLRSY